MTKKKINNLRILQIGLLILIFASFIPGIMNAGQILFNEDESRVWGYTYSLLGVDWSAYMQKPSLISVGYSLMLVPVAEVLKNHQSMVYGVAIIGNAIAMCISYLLLLYIVYRLFPRENKKVLTVISALFFLLPGFAAIKYLAVPDLWLLLIFSLCMTLLISICEENKLWKLVCFGIFLGIGVVFHAAMICIAVSGVLALLILVKEKRTDEKKAIISATVMMAVILFGALAENFIIRHSDLNISSSLSVFASGITEGINGKGIWGIVQSLFGKFYGIAATTIMMAAFGIISYSCKEIRKISAKKSFLLLSAILLFLMTSLYTPENPDINLVFDIRGVMPVLGPLFCCGVTELFHYKDGIKKICFTVGIFLVSSFTAVNLVEGFETDAASPYNSNLFTKLLSGIDLTTRIYLLAVLVIFIALLCLCVIENERKISGQRRKIFLTISVLSGIVLVVGLNAVLTKSDVIDPGRQLEDSGNLIADSLRGVGEDYPVYYLKEGKDQDEWVSALQFRLGTRQIQVVELKKDTQVKSEVKNMDAYLKAQKEKSSYFAVVSTDSVNMAQYAQDYDMLESTRDFAVLAEKDSEASDALETYLAGQIRTLDSQQDVCLPPGTYEGQIKIKVNGNMNRESGTVYVQAGKKVLTAAPVVLEESEGNGEVMAEVTFTSKLRMENINYRIELENKISEYDTEFLYRRAFSDYAVGIENHEEFQEICSAVKKLDEISGDKGTLQIISDENAEKSQNSITYVKRWLENYDIQSIQSLEAANADYLVSDSQNRAYYPYLKDYRILISNSGYTLMAKNASVKIEAFESTGNQPLTEGYRLNLEEYSVNGKANSDSVIQLSLPSGNYNYVLMVKAGIVADGDLGKINIKSKDELIAQVDIEGKDLDEEGKMELVIPISSISDLPLITYEVKNDQAELTAELSYVEMTSDKFQIGSDAEDRLKELTDTVKMLSDSGTMYFVAAKSILNKEMFSLDALKATLPDFKITSTSQSRIKYSKEDCFLLLYQFNAGYMGLLKNYAMIRQEGDYSLWVAKYGNLMGQVYDKNVAMISFDTKIPVDQLEYKEDGQMLIGPLSEGVYELEFTISGEDVQRSDVATVAVVGVLNEEEQIDNYIYSQIDSGAMSKKELKDEEVREEVRSFLNLEEILFTRDIYIPQLLDDKNLIGTVKFEVKDNEKSVYLRTMAPGEDTVTIIPQWISKE